MPESREKNAEKQATVDRRKAKRVNLTFQIEVSGFDPSGQLFREHAVTSDVSEDGCKFALLREVKPKDVLAIQLVRRGDGQPCEGRPLLFEVAWAEPSERGWTIGALKLQPDDMWHVGFPKKQAGSVR